MSRWWHVSAHLDMPTCVDMCRHVLTCADMSALSRHFRWRSFIPNLDAVMCQYLWTCRHVLICADMCWHVPTCAINFDTSYSDHLDLIWMLACVSICGHAGMCWYVPTCAGMCQHVKPLSAPLIPTNHLKLILHAGMCQLIGTCRYVLICAGMCWHVPCANMWHQPWHLL